jgi:hypothetical protein
LEVASLTPVVLWALGSTRCTWLTVRRCAVAGKMIFGELGVDLATAGASRVILAARSLKLFLADHRSHPHPEERAAGT